MALAYFMMGQYEDAAACAHRSLQEYSETMSGLRIGSASNAHLGRMEEAQRLATRARAVDPALTLSKVSQLIPLRRPGDMDRYLEGLRLAGLPE